MKTIGESLHQLHLTKHQYANALAQIYDVPHLYGPQGKVLHFLAKSKREDIIQRDIEQLLGISKASASSLIQRMVKNHLVCVESTAEDKRIKLIKLTPSSKKKLEHLDDFFKAINAGLIANLSQEELDQLIAIINKMITSMQEEIKRFETKEENK